MVAMPAAHLRSIHGGGPWPAPLPDPPIAAAAENPGPLGRAAALAVRAAVVPRAGPRGVPAAAAPLL
jgi:hypothetical protein